MKEIRATFTILRTFYLPDDFQQEDIDDAIQEALQELGLNINDVDDIEYD